MRRTLKTQPKQKEPQGRDLFQTPNYAVKLLMPYIPRRTTIIWEPAAGEGKIVRMLRTRYHVFASDIRDLEGVDQFDFLRDDFESYGVEPDVIITNPPPFSLKEEFAHRCMELKIPWALLIPAFYSQWLIEMYRAGCERIVPTRRISYIPPYKKGSSADFHSLWLTWGFNIGTPETYVELSLQDMKDI